MDQSDSKTQASPFNRTAQHDAKRIAILSQAAKLFNSMGSRTTTLKDIAQSLGLTKTSLYYYVKTKEELIYQCYMAALEQHHKRLDEIEKTYQKPGERSSAFFLHHFENWLAAREGRGPHIAALMEIASLKGSHREDVEKQYIRMFKRVRQYLLDGMEDGSIRRCDATSATRAALGSVEWAFSWLHNVPRDQVLDIARDALNVLGDGLYTGVGEYNYSSIPYEESPDETLLGFNREQQNRLKQEAFSKTGIRFFNKKGFAGTSLDDIAEHLNVSKGAFYYHINNKEDLLFSGYNRSLDIVEKIHQQASQLQGTGLQKIEQTCRRVFYAQNSSEGPLVRYNTITALPIPRRKKILQRTDASNQCFGDFIQAGIDEGSVRPINSYVAQQLIAGAINAAMDIALWRNVDDLEQASIDYFDIFLNGLSPRA